MRTRNVVTLLAVGAVFIIIVLQYDSQLRLRVKNPTEHVTVKKPEFSDGELMTPDEMLAVRYAKGKISKRTPVSWARYMNFLRAQLTKPPVPLADLGNNTHHKRNLDNPNKEHYSQLGQSETVDELLKRRRNGFFIECGAWDGEEFSNSLFFERHRNWTGLLIENDPNAYETLLKKNRTVYTYHGCLSPTGRSEMLPFRPEHLYSGVAGYIPNFSVVNGTRLTSLFCVPLNDLLAAMGRTHVDFLSLDIEGAESEVLRNFDFNAVRIDAMTVEFGTVRLQKIRDVVLRTGLYREAKVVGTLDVIFVRKDIN